MGHDTGESYRQMPSRMAQESAVATPVIDDLVRLNHCRKGQRGGSCRNRGVADPPGRRRRYEPVVVAIEVCQSLAGMIGLVVDETIIVVIVAPLRWTWRRLSLASPQKPHVQGSTSSSGYQDDRRRHIGTRMPVHRSRTPSIQKTK